MGTTLIVTTRQFAYRSKMDHAAMSATFEGDVVIEMLLGGHNPDDATFEKVAHVTGTTIMKKMRGFADIYRRRFVQCH